MIGRTVKDCYESLKDEGGEKNLSDGGLKRCPSEKTGDLDLY